MPRFIASYDLKSSSPNPHSTFLDEAKKLGWQCWILSSNDFWYRLPNTTLVGTFSDMNAAKVAFNAIKPATEAVIGVAVIVEKHIIAEYSSVSFNSDVTQKKK